MRHQEKSSNFLWGVTPHDEKLIIEMYLNMMYLEQLSSPSKKIYPLMHDPFYDWPSHGERALYRRSGSALRVALLVDYLRKSRNSPGRLTCDLIVPGYFFSSFIGKADVRDVL